LATKIYTSRIKFWEMAAKANSKAASILFQKLVTAKHKNSNMNNRGPQQRKS